MTNTTKRRIASVERYANALFQLAKEAKVLETVSSELTKLRNLMEQDKVIFVMDKPLSCLLYTSPSPRDLSTSRMPSSA